jgi:glycerol-3-phosphate O-acyltransferase
VSPKGNKKSLLRSLQLRWNLMLRAILHVWVKTTALPDVNGNMGPADGKIVCYVLDEYELSSILILDRVCEENNLPRPLAPIAGLEESEQRAYAVLRRRKGILIQRPSTRRASDVLKKLVNLCDADRTLEIQLVPVTVFVGRTPDKSAGLAKILFAENWEVAGRTRRLFSTLINGRDTLVQFSQPMSSRILRMHFRRVKGAMMGPDLSHRRMMVDRIVKTPAVRAAISEKSRRQNISEEKAAMQARKYALEIAADYSYRFIRIASMGIGWFTRKVLRGVKMNHFERVKNHALDNEIIYVPCHRSHMDYLLISYLLHTNGFVAPHVAAGVNLNLPLVGPFLRGGGAFYLRRSFRSQKLYSAVFNEYVATILAQGVSIEYFIEGTRSRTGRLLSPKAGMLAMTVKGYLHTPVRPVTFLPVYIGYEQLMEGRAYTRELSGKSKKSEKLTDLFKVFGVLKNDYGEATVNFGRPIELDQLLESHDPDWKHTSTQGSEKPPWMNALIDELGQSIMTGINLAADANPVNLLASTLLLTPRHSLGRSELRSQLTLYRQLLLEGPYSGEITVTDKNADEIIDYSESLGLINRAPNELGEIISVENKVSVELTYFRNNVAHLFSIPSLIACCFLNQRKIEKAQLQRIARAVFPFLKTELFLHWDEDGFMEAVEANLSLLVKCDLLSMSEDGESIQRAADDTESAGQLTLLARCLLQTLERYYITTSVLARNGSGALSRSQLEKLCILSAIRISKLYEIEAPEFYDRSLFRQFINDLKKYEILCNDQDGKLLFDERLADLSDHARFILRKEIRWVIVRAVTDAVPEDASEQT